jgi:hypothetical protein
MWSKPTDSDWRRRLYITLTTLYHRFDPYSCIDCGKDVDFKTAHFWYPGDETHSRIMVQCYHDRIPGMKMWYDSICGECLAFRIQMLFRRGLVKQKRCKCDGCKETKYTISISHDPYCDLRLGTEFWNGHNVCCDCLQLAASCGNHVGPGLLYLHNGTVYQVTERGTVIGLKRWYDLLLPDRRKQNEKI